MDIVYVGIGGALGSLARYHLGKLVAEHSNSTFPFGTFIINITGAVLLGVVSNIGLNNNSYILLGDGFLGAYTTFSTFMYEGLNLLQESEKKNALMYILLSIIFGIIAYGIGHLFAKNI